MRPPIVQLLCMYIMHVYTYVHMYVVCCNNVYILQVCQCWGERSVCDGHVDSAGSMAGCHSNPTGLEQALAGKTLSLSLFLYYISLAHSFIHTPTQVWPIPCACGAVMGSVLGSCYCLLAQQFSLYPPQLSLQSRWLKQLHKRPSI